MNSKERFIAVLKGEKPDRTPVFPLLMSFSATRIGKNYREFATSGSLLAEAQINIFETFGVDAITGCSDAFRITADLGAEMVFPLNSPPYSEKPLVTSMSDLKGLKYPDISSKNTRMYDRAFGVGEMARTVGKEVMVIGWVDMPFAEACSICGVQNMLMMLYDEPALVHEILQFLTSIVIDFASLQIEFGAEMIGCGDAAASLLSPSLYREFVLPYEKQVCEAIHKKNTYIKLHICGNTTALIEDMAQCGADLFNVDHLVDLKLAAKVYGDKNLAFKGNLDPSADMLLSTPEECANKALSCLRKMEGSGGYILSPGCEVPAQVSDEVFRAFCDSVK